MTDTIRITQAAIGGGSTWSAHTYPEGDVIVASCRDPFTAGARALIAQGYPPEATLMLVDKVSGLPSLAGVLGKVAKLRVSEVRGQPIFKKFREGVDKDE